MIILITSKVEDPKTGRYNVLISHGYDEDTGRTVILPNVTPEEIGAQFDDALSEYVIY